MNSAKKLGLNLENKINKLPANFSQTYGFDDD